MIVWNGISSDEIGVIVQHYPKVTLPKRKVEVIQIPGRNGDIIIDHEAYENYEQSYEVFLEADKYGGLEAVMPKLSAWLTGSYGYQRLEDSYFPEFYRMAYIANAHEFASYFNQYGFGTLTFNCAPQKFYKSGEREILVTNGQVIHNPSEMSAKPLIRFYINGQYRGDITFTTDGVSKSIRISNEEIVEDEEQQSDLGLEAGEYVIDVANHKFYSIEWTARERIDMPGAYQYSKTFDNKAVCFSGAFENLMLGKETTISWTNYTPSTSGNSGSLGYQRGSFNEYPGIWITPNWYTV